MCECVQNVFLAMDSDHSLAGEFHAHKMCESGGLFADKCSSSAHLVHVVFPSGSQQEADDTFERE